MLVTNSKEVNNWLPNSTFLDDGIPSIMAYLEAAEYTHLMPVVGSPLYNFLQEEYKREGEYENSHTKELLDKCQPVIVLFGLYGAAPALNITVNSSGNFTVTVSGNTVAASKDRTDKFIESTYTHAHNAVEQLLLYLEQNSRYFVNESGEELWKQSASYWQKTGCLIFTATEFNNLVFIDNSRILFNKIYPSIRLMERIKLRPAFGVELIKVLINRKMENSLTGHDEELLEHMQTALALLTVSQSEELSKPDSIHGFKPHDCDMMAEAEINEAKNILRNNPEEYPEYIENKPGFEPVPHFKNDSKNSIFVMGGAVR